MPRRIVPDNSVMIPAFFDETIIFRGNKFRLSRRASDLVGMIRARQVEAVAPEHLVYEFMKAAYRKTTESIPINTAHEQLLGFFNSGGRVFVPRVWPNWRRSLGDCALITRFRLPTVGILRVPSSTMQNSGLRRRTIETTLRTTRVRYTPMCMCLQKRMSAKTCGGSGRRPFCGNHQSILRGFQTRRTRDKVATRCLMS